MKTIILQHTDYWHGGVIQDIVEADVIFTRQVEQYPAIADIGLIIVLGGPEPLSYDEHWVRAAQAFLTAAIEQKRPVLSFGFGAQLVARALGGQIYPNPAGKEIGFFPVEATYPTLPFGLFPQQLVPFHWHSQTCQLPQSAMVFYKTPFCDTQAFLYSDRVLSFQFHLEMNASLLEALLTHEHNFIEQRGYFTQSLAQLRAAQINPQHHELLEKIIAHLQGRLQFL